MRKNARHLQLALTIRKPSRSLSLSEIMTICVGFHLSGYRNFKWYYTKFITKNYRKFFPKLVSYNRFVELMPHVAIPLTLFMQSKGKGNWILGICQNLSASSKENETL